MYECVIDFRLMDPPGLADARRGFRSVIHRAYYAPDAQLDQLMEKQRRAALEIDEKLEARAGIEFAAGAALAHKLRGSR